MLMHNKSQNGVVEFRKDPQVQVLLLPIHSGANGLNLIEAKHVLLVEPILNKAQELQAIGRIHRIGQTRPTVVHRFLVRGTIEEYIHSLLQAADHVPLETRNPNETTLTIGDLHDLFQLAPADCGLDEDDIGNEDNTAVFSEVALDCSLDQSVSASSDPLPSTSKEFYNSE